MRVAFRVDASARIGTGHVVRCLTLADQLRARGAQCLFVHRLHRGHLTEQIRHQGYEVLELPPPDENDVCPGDGYQQWLGITAAQDADETAGVLEGQQIDWLVVDHYALDAVWEKKLRTCIRHIAVIDDLANRAHDCDLLLDQNYFADPEKRYARLVPPECMLLTGPRYALLRPEYHELRRLIGPRRGPVSRVLVFYGGVDHSNETVRALSVLSAPEFSHLAVDVVVGVNNPHREQIESMVASRPLTELHPPKKHLASLMAEADVALGAGGTTTWERCASGLPAIVTAIARNQEPFNRALGDDGIIFYLGPGDKVTEAKISSALKTLVENPAKVELLARRVWSVTDGLGALRLAEVMMPGGVQNLHMRPVSTQDDVKTLVSLESDILPRGQDGGPETPIFGKEVFVVSTPQNLPVGLLHIVRDNDNAVLHCIPDRAFRGDDYTDLLLALGATAWRDLCAGQYYDNKAGSCGNDAGARFLRLGATDRTRYSQHAESLAITVLSDADSWLNDTLAGLLGLWLKSGHRVRWVHQPKDLEQGDLCFLLGCGQMVSRGQLACHTHNLVVHESDLPAGRGWSPLTWLVLDGADRIPVTLLEAVEEVDAGNIYLQEWISLEGHELIDELREKQAAATVALCRHFVKNYPAIVGHARPQQGEPGWYRRRTPKDSELDPDNSLTEQFNLLRVVDNQRYPAFFRMRGHRYVLAIKREDE